MDFKKHIAGALRAQIEKTYALKLSVEDIMDAIETPPNREMGNFALPCFRFAKELRMAPPKIAEKIGEGLSIEFVSRVEVAGGYLNFYMDEGAYARAITEQVLNEGEKYGSADIGKGGVVCMDYSSINIAKPFHIGHLLTTAIGNALYRIYEFLGYKPVGINHLGDWGTQFGKLIVAYKKWGDKARMEENPMEELTAIYVRFHEEAEADPSLEDEGRAWFRKIEEGDAEALEYFAWFKELTLREVEKVYDKLGIRFDYYTGESFYNDKMDRVIDELECKNLLISSEGAEVVDLEAHDMPPAIIRKSDGATLYITRDIAAALYRKETFDFVKSLYIVAYQQTLHFRQLFQVVEMMGYDWAKDMEHVAFGMVSMEDGAMSTRKGRVIKLEELLDRSIAKTKAIMMEKSPDLPDMDAVAEQVGVGAVLFWALSNNRIKDTVFSWDKALNFDGETGPYVQYTHARCNSVLKKAVDLEPVESDYALGLSDPWSQAVVQTLGDFPSIVQESCRRNEPSLVTRYSVDLAQAYNKFYYENRILQAEAPLRAARLNLTRAVKIVLRSALALIGMETPERM